MRSPKASSARPPHDLYPGACRPREETRRRGEQFAPLVAEFERMYELARVLNKKRQRRGSIDFDLPEPVIEFDAQGAMQSIVRSERSWANRLIEEFMLSANECVASWLENLGVPSLYRIHEKPEPRRVAEFEEWPPGLATRLGWVLPGKAGDDEVGAPRAEGPRRGPGPPAAPI